MFSKHFDVSAILEKYFAYFLIALIYSNQPVPGPFPGMLELGGRKGSCPPCFLLGGARGAKVPFKYKEYYITASFQGAFS